MAAGLSTQKEWHACQWRLSLAGVLALSIQAQLQLLVAAVAGVRHNALRLDVVGLQGPE